MHASVSERSSGDAAAAAAAVVIIIAKNLPQNEDDYATRNAAEHGRLITVRTCVRLCVRARLRPAICRNVCAHVPAHVALLKICTLILRHYIPAGIRDGSLRTSKVRAEPMHQASIRASNRTHAHTHARKHACKHAREHAREHACKCIFSVRIIINASRPAGKTNSVNESQK